MVCANCCCLYVGTPLCPWPGCLDRGTDPQHGRIVEPVADDLERSRPSQVRRHPRLDDINRDLVLKNGNHATIAAHYGLHPDAITRH